MKVFFSGLMEELKYVKWAAMCYCEIRTNVAYIEVLPDGHILCYKGLVDRKEYGSGL